MLHQCGSNLNFNCEPHTVSQMCFTLSLRPPNQFNFWLKPSEIWTSRDVLSRQTEVSWYITVFRDVMSPKVLLVSMQLFCGQNLNVLCGLSRVSEGRWIAFLKNYLGQAVVQASSNRSMFPLWVSTVVKQLPACEDKDSVNETVSAPTHTIALDYCLVSSLWSKSVFGDALIYIALMLC